jgi:uncharacterized membrane protein
MALIREIIHALLVVQPPHPLFVHFPIALISTALFFLLLALWRKSDILEKIAFADLCVAAVSILVAGAFGIRDNAVLFKGGAPNYIAKIVNASLMFVITTATVLLRWKNPDLFKGRFKWLYLADHLLLFAMVAVQGFLGGIIVYGF